MFDLLKPILSLLWLLLTLGVLVGLWRSRAIQVGGKVLWTLVVLLLPFLGSVFFLLLGDRRAP